MRKASYIGVIFLLFALAGCRTTSVIKPPVQEPVPEVQVPGKLNGYFLNPSWDGQQKITDVAAEIRHGIETASDERYNAVFFKPERILDEVEEIGDYAVELARENGLKVFFVVDLVLKPEGEELATFPEVKSRLRDSVVFLTSRYYIDGLCFEVPGVLNDYLSYEGFSLQEFKNDSTVSGIRQEEWVVNRVTDLLEDAVAGAMLVKSYLINTVVSSDPAPRSLFSLWLETGIVDAVIPGYSAGGGNPDPSQYLYPVNIVNRNSLKQITPRNVVGLDFSAVFNGKAAGEIIRLTDSNGRVKIADSNGMIGFISRVNDSIRVETTQGPISISTWDWSLPYKYSVLPGNKVERRSPWVEFRRMPAAYTNNPGFDLLCRSEYPSTVKINGQEVKQYKTGIFFNRITLDEGVNRVRASVMTADSLTAFYEQEYYYEKVDPTRQPFPLWIDTRSVSPAYDLELLPEDVVRISFHGSKGQEGDIFFTPGDVGFRCSRRDYGDYSLYQADIPVALLPAGTPCRIQLRIIPENRESVSGFFEYTTGTTITVRYPEDFPLLRVTRENSRLIYNLGAPRLGGPIRSEIGPGVVMKMNGRFGDNIRIKLSSVESGFIHRSEVELLPPETVKPSYYITSMSCGPSTGADVLTIPYLEPVPYEIYPDPDQKRLIITLFGAQTSSTWITHRQGLRIIDKITWQQTTPETYQVYVNLHTPEIWGYDLKVEGQRLVLRVKYPPKFDPESEKPLEGLKVAIEAGHGGSNAGAIGLSGLLEKDINLDLSFRLGELLALMGAEIVQVRDADIDMTLIEKRDKAINSGADILISIHANAGGTGYLQVAGTSTYWHNPFWAPLATTIHDRLLELDLAEFGVVGSFNYTGIRLTQMPSILVEQAFMSHAEDEEKMAEPEFRQQMAEKIYEGLVDWLKQLNR